MPLPPALAAKLAKRGLITSKQKTQPIPDPPKKFDPKGASLCPNKSNIFHECTIFCEINWKGIATPDAKYVGNVQKMLVKYPLPNNWTEIFDKGVGRYYYWNIENDLVSWLPPKHPKAVVTKSAARLRAKKLQDLKEKKPKERDDGGKRDRSDRDRSRDEKDRNSDDEDRGFKGKYSNRDRRDRDRDRDRDREDRRSRREKDDRYRRDKRKRDDQLDPMDPAAYSDIPQGTWSDGLESNKQRADNTASGVLFQQRPYPAPGAVLAANREKEEKEKRS